MTAAIIIPARYQSSRFPGKPLQPLRGATGVSLSLIRRTWDVAMSVSSSPEVYVATDDARIAAEARGFGASVIMTPESCRNGTERCAAAAADLSHDVIVNLQGDAPLTPVWFVEALIAAMDDPQTQVATPVLRCDTEAHRNFMEDRRAGRVGATTAVFGVTGQALYFSKEVLPYTDDAKTGEGLSPVFHHVGVYAYRRQALTAYGQMDEGRLERLEGLEQLRFLENGVPIQCVEVEGRGRMFWELNNPVDVARIEAALAQIGQP